MASPLYVRLDALGPTQLVAEATGGGERPLAAALAAAGLPLAVVDPRQARDFAKATGQLAKTDRLDASALAHFAEAARPPARPVPDGAARGLAAALACRGGREAFRRAEPSAHHRAHRLALGRPGAHRRRTGRDHHLRPKLAGPGTPAAPRAGRRPGPANTLLAAMPQLGSLSRHEVAALAGVAPLDRDSGTLRGKRAVQGGRARARGARYMAVLVATLHTPAIRAFYDRLCAADTPKKVAMTARRR